ncbi:hypothetical protein BH10BAC5_BH10BAC5_21210 [soil metagenome]
MAKTSKKSYAISYNSLLQNISKKIPKVMLLAVSEKSILDDLILFCSKKFLGNEPGPDSVRSYYADDKRLEDVLNECQSSGFFSEKKIVVLKNTAKLLKNDKLNLNYYIKEPNEDVLLILNASEDEFSADKYEDLDLSLISVYQISELEGKELEIWILSKLEDHSIDEDALAGLIEFSNSSADELLTEIEKIKLYTNDSKQITIKDVNLCNGINKDFKESEFLEAVFTRNPEKAIEIYDKLTLKKDIEILLIFMLSSAAISISKLMDRQLNTVKNDWELKSKLKIWRDFEKLIKIYREYCKTMTPGKLNTAISALHDADKLLKSSNIDKKNVIVYLINTLAAL